MKPRRILLILMVILSSIIVISYYNWLQNPNRQNEVVVLETSKGLIEIELYRTFAPITVDNFVQYVEEDFYDGLVFHRVVKNFVIQAGGFYSNGTYKEPTRDPILLESNNSLPNIRGSIAMARTHNPNSATTQFFINVNDNPNLDHTEDFPGHAVFGKVIRGIEIVDEINQVETDIRLVYIIQMPDWPVEDVIIEKAYMKN